MFYIRAMNNLRVFLALILILIFYHLFNISDKIKIIESSNVENFTDDINTETEQKNIQVYLNQRLTNFNLSISEIKELLQKDLNIYKADNPIIIDNNVEVDSAKIKSDSPVFIPTNLYIDGPLKINNRDEGENISKNLAIGNAELSERDLMYLTNYILPFAVTDEDGGVRKVCIENPDRLGEYITLNDLEVDKVPQGLVSSEQINRMLQIVKEYHFDLSIDTQKLNSDLLAAKTLSIDYNLFNLVKSYPELINQLKPGLTTFVSKKGIGRDERIDNEYVVPLEGTTHNLEKYFTEKKPLKYNFLKNRIYHARTGYGYGRGRNLTRSKDYRAVINKYGIQRYKLEGNYFKSKIIKDAIDLYGIDDILNGNKITEFCEKIMEDTLAEYNVYKNKINSHFEKITDEECLNGDDLKRLSGEKSIRLSSRTAERLHKGWWAQTPYLQDRYITIHSANHDDNDDCTAKAHIKTSVLSNKRGRGEIDENGNFKIVPTLNNSGNYDTGIVCKPE